MHLIVALKKDNNCNRRKLNLFRSGMSDSQRYPVDFNSIKDRISFFSS